MGDLDRFTPVPRPDLLDLWEIASPNPENNLFRCYLFRPCPIQKRRELTERARADIIERRDFLAKLFIAPRKNLYVSKSQFSSDFREKRDFLDVRFDDEDSQVWPDDLQGQTRKSGARSYVGEPTSFEGYSLGCIHAFTEMTIKYLQRVADGGQVYLLVPSQQNPYILLNLKDLIVIGRELKFSESTTNYGR
jgi:hypothetical protein